MTLFSLTLISIFFIFIGLYHRYGLEDSGENQPNVGLFTIAAALFVVVGSGEYDLSLAMIIDYGWAGLSFLVGLAVSLVLISAFAKRIWSTRESVKQFYKIDGFVNFTTPDFLNVYYGKKVSLLATIVVSLCFFGLYILQVFLGGLLLSTASGVSIAISSLLIGATVIIYAIAGGFYSLFRTDLFQAILMYLSLTIATVYSILAHSETIDYFNFASSMNERALNSLSMSQLSDDPTLIAVFLLTLCAAFSGADLWQRVNVSSGAASAKAALIRGAVAILVFGSILYFFAIDAISAMEASGIKTSTPFVSYLELILKGSEQLLPWSGFIIAVFSIGLLAAFVSTADTCLLLTASSIQNEAHRWTGRMAKPSHDGSIHLSRTSTSLLIGILGVSGLLLSLLAPNIVEQFLIVLGALAVLGIPVLATLLGFGNKLLVSTSIVLGSITTIYVGYIEPDLNSGWGLLLPCLPGIICFIKRR